MFKKNPSNDTSRMSPLLVWKRPFALWLLPLIFLFLATTLPLLAERNFWAVTAIPLTTFISLVVSFILAHHFFSFLHSQEKSDFYFSLPASRTRMFLSLNLSALVHLLGPSLAMMAVNSLLASLFSTADASMPWFSLSLSSTWISYLGLLVRLLYFFFLLEICYLVTDKSVTANIMFILINLFWPLMLFLYSDAASQMLPGFINPITTAVEPTAWMVLVFQLFSPVLFTGGLNRFILLTGLMALAAGFLAYLLFRRRKAGYTPGLDSINWPFQMTQWMGVMSLTLLGGYTAHYLRILTSGSLAAPADVSPAPFLIGSGLGLLFSLWVFNLFAGKGKIVWRPLLITFAATALPFALWLALVMTGAGGFSSKLPPEDQLKSATLHYEDIYVTTLAQYDRPYTLVLDRADDLALFARIVQKTVDPGNPGLGIPRTLSSAEQLREHIRLISSPPGYQEDYAYFYANDIQFSLETKSGQILDRSLLLPLTVYNPDYLQLIRQNRAFYLAELSSYGAYAKFGNDFSLIPTSMANSLERETWIDPLIKALQADDYLSDTVIRDMVSRINLHLLDKGQGALEEMLEKAPLLIRVSLTIPRGVEADPGDYELLLPVLPQEIPSLENVVHYALGIYDNYLSDQEGKDSYYP